MAYNDQLKRHDPFKFHPPNYFSPWADRLLIELRQHLKELGQNARSIRKTVQLLDLHLIATAEFALKNSAARQTLAVHCEDETQKKKFLDAKSVDQLRSAISDFDLKIGINFHASHLIDIPPGWYDIDLFVKIAALSLWKMAEAVEAFGDVEPSPESTRRATKFALESIAAANLAIAIRDSDTELKREISNLGATSQQAAQEEAKAGAARVSERNSKSAADGHASRTAEAKRLLIQLVNGKSFYFYSTAAKCIDKAFQANNMHFEINTIKKWLKESGWKPLKREGVQAKILK